jgi:hypothetical protein
VTSGFAQIRVDVRTSVTSNRFGGVWLEPLWQRFPVSPATYNRKFCININHDCGDINRFSSNSTESVKQYGAGSRFRHCAILAISGSRHHG